MCVTCCNEIELSAPQKRVINEKIKTNTQKKRHERKQRKERKKNLQKHAKYSVYTKFLVNISITYTPQPTDYWVMYFLHFVSAKNELFQSEFSLSLSPKIYSIRKWFFSFIPHCLHEINNFKKWTTKHWMIC